MKIRVSEPISEDEICSDFDSSICYCITMAAVSSATPNPNPLSHHSSARPPPLLPSKGDNGVEGPPRPRAREVTSRYMCSSSSSSSATSSSSSGNSFTTRSCASPLVSRTRASTSAMTPMRSVSSVKRTRSVDRRRPGTPWASSTVDSRAFDGAPASAASKIFVHFGEEFVGFFSGGVICPPDQ